MVYLKPEEAMIHCNLGEPNSPRNALNTAFTRPTTANISAKTLTKYYLALRH
jgi:hypothetical protein